MKTVDRRHAFVLGTIFAELLFIIWFFQYLPMVDLPQHVLTAKVLTHYADPVTGFDEFFTKKIPWNPYSSYFWFVMALEPIFGVMGATRLYLSLALILTIVAFGVWLREAAPGRDAQMIPATLLLLGLFFYTGLINYLFSVPFMFFSFALSSRLVKAKDSKPSTEIWLAIALLVTYFSHVVTFGITLFVIGVQQIVVFRTQGIRRLIRASAPSVALLAVWMGFGMTSEVSGLGWSYDPFLKRLEYLLMPFNVFVQIEGNSWVYNTRTVASWAVFVAAALFAGREKLPAPSRNAAPAAAALVFSTLFFPSWIANSSGAPRLSYPAAFAVLALLPAGWDGNKALRWIVIAICVLNPLLIIPRLVTFQTEMAQLENVIRAIPERQIIQSVITELNSRHFQTYPFLHSAAWYNFYKGGTNPYLFARVAHFPIKERRAFVPHPPGDWHAADFRYEEHQEGTNYFIVRTRREDIIADLTRHVPLAARSGDWMAFGPNSK